ncbi:hypothetical protein FO519_000146 [Halicephalobus sp. NKZ332]|nr:hypothetical protein FO519_000146 [Halicephalobus sp. NKZ332]
MQEERLRNVLNSLSHLADHGEIPVHAFGTLLRAAKTDAITEHLHQKWLSDPNFARLAAQIVYHFHTLDNHDVSSLTSGCLAHALRDYKCRSDIRSSSRQMFRNYTRTLAEFYNVYKHIDLCLAQTLVAPLFNCLDNLLDDQPDDEDVKSGAQIITSYGHLLTEQSISETTQLVMKSRQLLCSNTIPLSEETKNILMAVSDLWGAGWKKSKLPEILQIFHDERCNFVDYFSQYNKQRSSIGGSHRSRSSSGYGSPVRTSITQVVPSKKIQNEPLLEDPESTLIPENLEPRNFETKNQELESFV